MERSLRAADQVWRKRSQDGGLEESLQQYLDADRAFPEDGRVLWRLARVYTIMGDLSPDAALRHYGTAKEFGVRCLMMEPSFAGVVLSRGGMVVPEAAAEVTEASKECLVWTVIAWSKWVRLRGAAGVGLDLETLAALGARAGELGGNWGGGRGHYAHALALSLPPPALGPDLAGAKAAFERAVEAAPERYPPRVDLALFVLPQLGETDEAERVLREVAGVTVAEDDPEYLEDRHAVERARRALGDVGSDRAADETHPGVFE